MVRALAILLVLSSTAMAADVLPYLGNSCPYGYSISGNYCKPSSNARPAIVKQKGKYCPYNWVISGVDYCLANDKNAQLAIIKNGACPYGYFISGSFCVKKE